MTGFLLRRPDYSKHFYRPLPSPNAEADVADGFAAEALFQFSQDLGLRNLFEFVMQGRLRQTHL